jgi:hypothetical protein
MRVPELASRSGGGQSRGRKGGKPSLLHSCIWTVRHGAAPTKSSAESLQFRRQRPLKFDSNCYLG